MIRTFLVALALVLVPVSAHAQLAPQDVVSEPAPIIESEVVNPPVVVAPPAPEVGGADFSPFFKLLTDTLSAALIAVLTAGAAWVSVQLGKLTGGRIKLDDVLKDLRMEEYAGNAVDKALSYALNRVGVDQAQLQNVQVKSQVLQYAAQFLASQYPEVVKWIDTNDNGVIDWVETRLPPPVPALAFAGPEAMAFTKPKAPRAPKQVRTTPVTSQPA
jgi:hypothetical protein